ncbi:protein EI24 homolog isoform X2 [Mangifera indica]|uniref:protein EI24 homolog isoform X2 n=1 Tax=Mangifera indica TaxID=29780 RepID=UPI001CFB47C7|nr:protein EI24 homolog isoform X2 [Mangifera indica]
MEISTLMNLLISKSKQALLLWLEGFREACCLHRVVVLCHRSRKLTVRTGQCFLLNGFIFLGRYNDIAKYGFAAMGRSMQTVPEPSRQKETSQNADQKDRSIDLGGIMIGIGEQVYSVLLLSFFFLEVYATGFIPYIGKAINFLLLAWLYAYYCFEYKWNFSEVGLDKRLDFFESNWAFFAGFGSPCVLAIFFFSPLVSYGVMAILFPLFVLTATGSRAEDYISLRRREWKGAGLGRLPIFYAADTLSLRILSFFHFHLECGKLKQEGTLSKKLS